MAKGLARGPLSGWEGSPSAFPLGTSFLVSNCWPHAGPGRHSWVLGRRAQSRGCRAELQVLGTGFGSP